MRKFTLLLLLLPFFGFSQTFDFNNSDDGWNILNQFTAETHDTYYTLTTKPGDGEMKNPSVRNENVGANADEVTWIGITLRNNDAEGPDYLRVSYPKTNGSGRVYKNVDITTGDTEFKTYWLDLTNSNWTGTVNDVQIHFKSAGNTDYVLPENPVSIDFDKIQFLAFPETTMQNEFYFDNDGDTEGFAPVNAEISGVSGGVLSFVPVVNKYAKLVQILHHVDATNNKYLHVTMKNNSAQNNQLRFVSPSGGFEGAKTMEISVSDADFVTYTFDLSADTNWTGNQTFFLGIGSLETNKPLDDGVAEFTSIVFDNDVTGVTTNKATEFSLYPNPARDFINIESPKTISSVAVMDITGKVVINVNNLKNNRINVSDLMPGVYMVSVKDNNDNVSTQRLIISE